MDFLVKSFHKPGLWKRDMPFEFTKNGYFDLKAHQNFRIMNAGVMNDE